LRVLPATPDAHHSYSGGLLEHTVAVATICRLDRGPLFLPTDEGKLLGHVHLGLRLIEERAGGVSKDVLAEVLHAVAVHHDFRAARTAEAAVLYHANQLDSVAATRPTNS
jgi:3'-5' exoribonuclease